MKDNIESKNIGNRKFIIELRFNHKVTISDKKGAIIENIKALNLFNPINWEIGIANIHIWDTEKKKDARNNIFIELNRFCFVSNKIDSVESFYNIFEKIFSCFISEIGDIDILRIGSRIQGTYKTNTNNYDNLLDKIKKGFPSQFYLTDYPATDLMFQLNYKNGMYNIGPVNDKKDPASENPAWIREDTKREGYCPSLLRFYLVMPSFLSLVRTELDLRFNVTAISSMGIPF